MYLQSYIRTLLELKIVLNLVHSKYKPSRSKVFSLLHAEKNVQYTDVRVYKKPIC